MPDLLSPVQLVGYLGFLATAAAFLLHEDRTLKAALAAGAVIWTMHYFLLGAHTAALVSVVIAMRQFASIWTHAFSRRTRHTLAAVFIVAFSAATLATWQGPVSLLPWLAAVNATYALFYLRGVRMRMQLVGSDLSWLVNGLWFGSVGQVTASLLVIGVNVATIRRLSKGG